MANTQTIPSTWEAEPERSRAWGLARLHITSQWQNLSQKQWRHSHQSCRMIPAAVLCPAHAPIHACTGMFRTHKNTYAMRGNTHCTHIHMTDKIFIIIGYLFILCMCMGQGHVYTMVHSLRSVDDLQKPVLSSCPATRLGSQAWQELSHLTSS